MPRDGSGVYHLPAGNPVVTNTLIESAWANTTLDDISNALTGSLPRNGTAGMSANLNFNSFKGINVATGTNPNDAVNLAQVQSIAKVNTTKVRKLVANNNAATPNSKVDMKANGMVMRNAAGLLFTVLAPTSTLTCDLGLAGPAANGRDQVAVFGASAVVHLYFIYNPTTSTTATIASLNEPFSGAPTLPSGYEYWCYAYTVVLTGAAILYGHTVAGPRVSYTSTPSLGTPTTSVTIGIRPYVPEIAETWSWQGSLGAGASSGGNCYASLTIGTTSNQIVCSIALAGVAGSIGVNGRWSDMSNANATLTVTITLSDTAVSSGTTTNNVVDYVVPNY